MIVRICRWSFLSAMLVGLLSTTGLRASEPAAGGCTLTTNVNFGNAEVCASVAWFVTDDSPIQVRDLKEGAGPVILIIRDGDVIDLQGPNLNFPGSLNSHAEVVLLQPASNRVDAFVRFRQQVDPAFDVVIAGSTFFPFIVQNENGGGSEVDVKVEWHVGGTSTSSSGSFGTVGSNATIRDEAGTQMLKGFTAFNFFEVPLGGFVSQEINDINGDFSLGDQNSCSGNECSVNFDFSIPIPVNIGEENEVEFNAFYDDSDGDFVSTFRLSLTSPPGTRIVVPGLSIPEPTSMMIAVLACLIGLPLFRRDRLVRFAHGC